MPTFSNPTEIARETFRLLATRRIAPTPDNYRTVTTRVAGSSDVAESSFPAETLKALASRIAEGHTGTNAPRQENSSSR